MTEIEIEDLINYNLDEHPWEEIENFPKGESLDMLIADRIMGWRWQDGKEWDYPGMVLVGKNFEDKHGLVWLQTHYPGDVRYTLLKDYRRNNDPTGMPLYSADAEAALEVMYTFQQKHIKVMVYMTDKDEMIENGKEAWHARVGGWHGWGDEIPLAVCRAALAWLKNNRVTRLDNYVG